MLLPLFVDVSGKTAAIAGAGRVGMRRAKKLVASGAKVFIYSKVLPTEKLAGAKFFKKLLSAQNLGVLFKQKPFLVVAAASSVALNKTIAREAKRRGVLASCAGAFLEGDVVFPASARRGKTVFCVATGSPEKSREKIKRIAKLL